LLLFISLVVYLMFAGWISKRDNDPGEDLGNPTDVPRGLIPSLKMLGLVAIGLTLLILGSRWMVNGATAIAEYFGVSDLIIGLTVVAIGTSLPEVAATVVAALRGERDIAVGNAIGSNLFNILSVLGLTALVAPQGVQVAHEALLFDIPVMIVVAIACLPIFFTNYSIDRWEGWLFLGYYIAYTAFLVLSATGNAALPMFESAMTWFALPLTTITLIILTIRSYRANRHGSSVNA
jgi:cation:H+ antiporter